MNASDLPAGGALATDALYFLANLGYCVLALLGAGHLAQRRRPQPAPAALPPLDNGDNDDQLLKAYLEHYVLC